LLPTTIATIGNMPIIALKEVPAHLANFILHLIESEGVVTSEGFKIGPRDK